MKKFFMAALLMGLSGTVLAAPAYAQSLQKDIDPLTPDFDKYIEDAKNTAAAVQNLKKASLALQKKYEEQLYALNKSKGYDPKIYKKIVNALDSLRELTAIINELDKPTKKLLADLSKDERSIKEAFDTEDEDLTTIRRDIKNIEKMKPQTPKTFPHRCADTTLAGQYKAVEGFIDKATGSPTGWALKTAENKEYPISRDVGLIGTGELINPSYTPQNYKDSGWYDSATKKVVCLKQAEVVGNQ